MIYFRSKPLIFVNSVMVVLSERREMVTHLPTRFHAYAVFFRDGPKAQSRRNEFNE
ncbi:MAG: hypothetical protein JO232_22785 [Verrucomicrobia bacterium]|nr:hypothetical protein [Verrucomicrobiota bacterium]